MEQVYAFLGPRAIVRKAVKGERRHAVLGGERWHETPQAECFRPAAVQLGPWQPGHPDNCPDCERLVGAR